MAAIKGSTVGDALRDLVSFVKFKKREKYPWWIVASTYNFTRSNTPSCVFFTFLKLYKWFQIDEIASYIDEVELVTPKYSSSNSKTFELY